MRTWANRNEPSWVALDTVLSGSAILTINELMGLGDPIILAFIKSKGLTKADLAYVPTADGGNRPPRNVMLETLIFKRVDAAFYWMLYMKMQPPAAVLTAAQADGIWRSRYAMVKDNYAAFSADLTQPA